MGEVRYSVNGKYFKDWNVFVSDSEGLFDALKRKKVNSYQWAEYHGQSVDLSNPKYEAREITLKCFVVGDNWVVMKENHDAIVSEFQKSGTQRLLIEPFGLKPLPYEVYMEDSSELQKTFKEGKMAGVFSLKLIEPNPIKKVLYFTGSSLNLAYNSPKETEIFYGNGLKETASGNVSLNGKTLANRVVSGYAFEGRNLFTNGIAPKPVSMQAGQYIILNGYVQFQGATGFVNMSNHFQKQLIAGEPYTITIKYRTQNIPITNFWWYINEDNIYKEIMSPDTGGQWNIISDTRVISGNVIPNLHLCVSNGVVDVAWITIRQTSQSNTSYTPAPEDEKIIIIAGNVDEITGLTTNAEVLWEKL